MNEFNPNSANPSEQDPPTAINSGIPNPLQNEMLQWQVDKIKKVVDKNNDGISKEELATAVKTEEHDGIRGLSNLTKQELEFVKEKMYKDFDKVKDLHKDHRFLPDNVLSDADLKALVSNQPLIRNLDQYFDQRISDFAEHSQLENHNQLDQRQVNYTRDVLKAMAKGDKAELAEILNRYSHIDHSSILPYTSKINEILNEKGGQIVYTFDQELGHRAFRQVVFPRINAQAITREHTDSSGITIYAAPEKRGRH